MRSTFPLYEERCFFLSTDPVPVPLLGDGRVSGRFEEGALRPLRNRLCDRSHLGVLPPQPRNGPEYQDLAIDLDAGCAIMEMSLSIVVQSTL